MKRLGRRMRLVVLVGTVPFTSGCVAGAIPAIMPAMSGLIAKAGDLIPKKSGGPAGPSVDEAQQEAFDGPKARVAVSRFEVKAAGAQGVVGAGLADMLSTALFQSNRFIVLERQALGEVIAEQDLGSSGRVGTASAARTGEIEGVELLVTGVVTEFDPGSAVFGAGVGSALGTSVGSSLATSGGYGYSTGGYLLGTVIGEAVGSLRTSHLTIDVRLIDVRTSRIVAATTVEGQAVDFAGGGWSGGSLAIGLAGFSKTPMEKAIRVAIQDAVKFVAHKTPAQYYRHQDATSGTATPQGSVAPRSFGSEGRMANPGVRATAARAAPSAERPPGAARSAYLATYRVTGTARRVVLDFRVGQRLTQSVRVVIPAGRPWELSFDTQEGDSLFVSAATEEPGSLSCEILLDGATLTADESGESGATVNCTGVASQD